MGADNPTETEHSPVASGKEQTRQILVWAGYFCGAMAFLFWPIILGPAGIIIGVGQ
jgi:membrane protein required for beta-lactamase induction